MTRDWTRRGVMAASAGAAAVAAAGPVAAQDTDGDFDGWLDDADNYDGSVADATGQDAVTVEVGADGNGGTFAFAPPAVRVDPGTTVTFEWTSNTHNILIEAQPDDGGWGGVEAIEDAGFTHEFTFETEGTYKYFCEPHLSVGMKGVVVVGGSSGGGDGGGTPVPVGEPDFAGWFGGDVKGGAVGNYDETVDMRGQSEATVEVGADGNGGSFAFAPPAVRVDPGTTVTFEWVSDTHNVLVEAQPDGGGWGGVEAIENTGFSHEFTFETEGIYKYYCEPHLSVGMKGAVVVGDVGPVQTGPGVELTGLERSILGAGIAAGLLAPVAFALVGRLASGPAAATAGSTEDAPAFEPSRAVGHDEFDPGGTLRLVLVYFGILVVMWVLMYFVEFLGNGPTVIG